jgi:hypothetical protein
MPYTMTQAMGGKFKVKSPHGVKAKGTTRKKAVAQMRLLRMKVHGVTPKGGWRMTDAGWRMTDAIKRHRR